MHILRAAPSMLEHAVVKATLSVRPSVTPNDLRLNDSTYQNTYPTVR